MLRKISTVALLALASLAVSACGPDSESGTAPSSQSSATSTTAITANPAASTTSPMPTKLPTFDNEANTEQTVWQIVRLAASTAKGVSADDRKPDVLAVTSQVVCIPHVVNIGLEKQIDACYPHGPSGSLNITFSPVGVWANVQKDETRGGGQVWTQDHVLAAYMNYLLFREGQRQGLMTATDSAVGKKLQQISLCKQGNVIGGLRDRGLMSSAHNKLYSHQDKQPDFQKGLKGEC
jgi:hypothetical protein